MGGPGSGRRKTASSPDRGWRDWYQLLRWRRIAKNQLRREPICRRCLERGIVRPATVADHIEPHGGDWNRFILGKLQSLCADCHDRSKQFEDRHGYRKEVGEDGWPIDPKHPINR
jgi:5-methylcytosine-specific restriction enzyme A